MEVLATAIRQGKEIQGIQIGKEEVKPSLFADDMIVYTENPIDSTRKPVDLRSEFGKMAGYKNNTQKLKAFCTPMKYLKQKLGGKNPTYYSNKKNKILRNKIHHGSKRPVFRKLDYTEERN